MKKAYLLKESSGQNGDYGMSVGITLDIRKAKDWKKQSDNYEYRYFIEYDFLDSQPERSKREDFVDLDIKILEKALKNAHREGVWDQEQYDQMYTLVQKYKDAVL